MGRDDHTSLISTHSQSLGYGSITHSQLQSASGQTPGGPLSRPNGLGTDVERQGPGHQRYLQPVYSIISTIRPPSIETLRLYGKLYFKGDIIAALTVASLYIPLSFSFANLAHVSPASSLYAFVFHPIIYALLGSAPPMIVGPEATGSLLIGAAIQKQGHDLESASSVDSLISGAITALAGPMLIGAGLLRLGFLEKILSPPFRHGFTSGVGFVLIIEQAFVSFGLDGLAKEMRGVDGGAVHKLGFMVQHLARAHCISAVIALSSLAFILIISATKKRMGKQNALILLFLDRLVAVAATAVVTYLLGLDKHGVAIVGRISMMEEAYPDFASFLTCRAWCELSFLVIVFLTIALHSMGLGITVGIGLTLPSSIRRSTKSHAIMQTKSVYLPENQTSSFLPPQKSLYIVARVDPSLTFTNINHFKSRLIECMACQGQIMDLILDFKGTTQMDFCGGQALTKVLQIFSEQGHVVLCCRPPPGEVHRVLLSCCVIAHTGQEEYVEDVIEAQAILSRAS